MFQLLSSVYAAGKQLARRRPGRRRGRPNPASRDHHRRCHDFDHGEVVRARPEAALRPPFPAGEAAGHDPAVLEPDAVQRLRHGLGDVVVPAGPYHTRHQIWKALEATGMEMVGCTDESMMMTLEPLPILLR